ncbi:MAG TPA: SMC-Scp complex subunit ScpB [Bacteroidota bacterium]|nr:SMC-Scp complex subunit ScpB [Bacteroidota bacterium]
MDQHFFENTRNITEALIFASDEPITAHQIIEILGSTDNHTPRIRIKEEEVLQIIRELNAQYVRESRSFRIIQVAGGYQFATMPTFAEWLGRLVKEKAKRKLSQVTLETLSVIAYKQPVTKPEMEAIRGVSADYSIQKLLERGLITIVGRAASPGRPLLYGTTQDFLKHFGLNDLSELPKPREIEEIMADQGLEMERELLKRMGKTDEEIEESMGKTVVGENGKLYKLPPDFTQEAEPDPTDEGH